MIYSEKIRDLREYEDVKQADIARFLDLDPVVYGHFEREETIMPIKHLMNVANYFDVSLDYIFNFNNLKKYDNIQNIFDKTIAGKRLKEFRKENKLTQDKLAKILNIGQSTIAEYERGTNIIATPFLYTICKKYKISADYLLGRIDEPKYLK